MAQLTDTAKKELKAAEEALGEVISTAASYHEFGKATGAPDFRDGGPRHKDVLDLAAPRLILERLGRGETITSVSDLVSLASAIPEIAGKFTKEGNELLESPSKGARKTEQGEALKRAAAQLTGKVLPAIQSHLPVIQEMAGDALMATVNRPGTTGSDGQMTSAPLKSPFI